VVALAVALACAGWWWGSVRLAALDRSVLVPRVGTAERALLEVTAPPRRSRYRLRVAVVVRRFGGRGLREASLLELPPGRAPPQGVLVSAVVTVEQPRGPDHGFDERTWLRRKGVHVVLRADRWRDAGARRGLGAIADRLRARVETALARGASGEREAVLAGVVLGDDQAVPEQLRERFRASGLYHMLAVSGQNVALVAVGALLRCSAPSRWRRPSRIPILLLAYRLRPGPQNESPCKSAFSCYRTVAHGLRTPVRLLVAVRLFCDIGGARPRVICEMRAASRCGRTLPAADREPRRGRSAIGCLCAERAC
jgi:predicted membrane metal-binding protein